MGGAGAWWRWLQKKFVCEDVNNSGIEEKCVGSVVRGTELKHGITMCFCWYGVQKKLSGMTDHGRLCKIMTPMCFDSD